MNRISLIIRQRILGIIFIIIAVMGGIFVFWYVSNLKARVSEDAGYREVFIAGADIEQGEEIIEGSIEVQKIPENIFSEKFITDKDIILGKKAAENILKGEIMTMDKIEGLGSNEGFSPGFSSYIPYQLRAVSVPVSFYGDKSLVRTGDRVDIVSTYYETESGNIYSDTVLTEKEIVLIGSDLEKSRSGDESGSEDFFVGSIFDSGLVDSGYVNLLILTFYLDKSEVEEVFLALEKGVLNLSICPKNYPKGR